MLRYREIVELRSIGLSLEKVAYFCGCSTDKVKKVCERASKLGLEWPVPIEFGEDELYQLLDPSADHVRQPPDYKAIFDAVCEKGFGARLTKKHFEAAWSEHLKTLEETKLSPRAKRIFRKGYSEWHRVRSKGVTMRINWTPGEEIQVDWAGSTIPLYSADGSTTPAYLFVATSPYSCYTFVRASLDMGMQNWLEHHRRMFEFFGGVPLFLAPDNLATGVTFKKDERIINRKYQELADHYGTIVVPTRKNSPKDKAAVEGHVKCAAGRFIGVLKQMRFTSIEQLNYALGELVEVFNGKPSHTLGISRREIFIQNEAEHLGPLPEKPFTSVTWKKCKASSDAVVCVRGVYYGIPENYANEKVIARITDDYVDVFTRDRKQMLAHHVRHPDGSETFEGFAGQRPDRFKPLDEWAEQNGREAILSQWHPTRNEGLTPHDVVCHSLKQMWWQCPDCGYEWQETPHARTKRKWDDCLACADIDLVPGRNDLAALFPDIAAEWHPTKNGCKPSEVFPDYHMLAWWVGAQCGHEWRVPISQRTDTALGSLCPYCSGKEVLPGLNDVASLCPELTELWHPIKNRERKPENTPVCSTSRVYLWEGPLSDIWMESPRAWMLRNGYEDVLEPFERIVKRAKALDADLESEQPALDAISKSKLQAKWSRYANQWAKDMSLEDWCLSFAQPELLKEWHPERNGDLTPKDVSRGSIQKVWWRCENGHEWRTPIADRTALNLGCSVCTRDHRVHPGVNDLASCKPSLLKWYSSRNGELAPDQVSDRFCRDIWWECPNCGSEWQMPVNKIAGDKLSCPVCGRKGRSRSFLVRGANDLATKRPLLAAEWHPTKNGDLKPDDVLSGSHKAVWWRCGLGHEWKAVVSDRARGSGCPYCKSNKVLSGFNDFATKRPDLAAEWHPARNGDLAPSDVSEHSNKRVWWRCEKGHEWKVPVKARSDGKGCPYCSNKKVLPGFNDLATTHPRLAAEWHPARNGSLQPNSVTAGSNKKAWWQCEHGHEWEAVIHSRASKRGCPVCSGRTVIAGVNDLASNRPEIAAFWHPVKNGKLTPKDVSFGSSKKVWWLGECGHEWQAPASGYLHVSRINCPYCTNRRVLPGFNDLAATHPKLAAEWNHRLNKGLSPKNVTASSSKKAWWVCPNKHSWEEAVRNRAKLGYVCPYCRGRKVPERNIKLGLPSDIPDKQRIGISLEQWCKDHGKSSLLKEWHLEKNEGLSPKDVFARTTQRVWWRCDLGHEWRTPVSSRTKATGGTGCPYCAGNKILVGFNDLATTHPQIAAEWHPSRNGDLGPTDVAASAKNKVWWRCGTCGHEWEVQVRTRKKLGNGCPQCRKEQRRKHD